MDIRGPHWLLKLLCATCWKYGNTSLFLKMKANHRLWHTHTSMHTHTRTQWSHQWVTTIATQQQQIDYQNTYKYKE